MFRQLAFLQSKPSARSFTWATGPSIFQTNDPCVEPNIEPAFIDGFIGDISEGQFVMHFNRDSGGNVTSFDAALIWSGRCDS